MLPNISRILFPKNCSPDIFVHFVVWRSLLAFFLCGLIYQGCSKDPFKSPKALLKTFCYAYNTGDDRLLNECGRVDYVLKQIAVEKFDADGNPYYERVKGLSFKIVKVHKGRIGIQKEYSDKRILIDVIFRSEEDPIYERKVTIYMSQKKSTTNAPARWQINLIPS